MSDFSTIVTTSRILSTVHSDHERSSIIYCPEGNRKLLWQGYEAESVLV